MKKISGWYRLFIVFTGVWTVVSIGIFFLTLTNTTYNKERIEEERLNSAADTINELYFLLNKKNTANLVLSAREERTFKLRDNKVLGLPEKLSKNDSLSNFSSRLHVYVESTPDIFSKEEVSLIKNEKWHNLADLLFLQYPNFKFVADIENRYKANLNNYYEERRRLIFLIPLYWLTPIGLVYGVGWCVGWIRRGFTNDHQPPIRY